MSCEYCYKNQFDLLLFILPCGYSVCYEHLTYQDTLFKCLVCQDHLIEKKSCFEMRKNRKKLDEMEFLELKQSILLSCDKIDILKKDIKFSVNENFSNVINQIDLKRELLKYELDKLVDDYHESLLKEVKNCESKFVDLMEAQIKQINTEKIRTFLSQTFDDKDIKTKNNYLSELKIQKFDILFNNFEKLKNFKFNQSFKKSDIDFAVFFGTINSTEVTDDLQLSSKEPEYKNSVPFLNKFNLRCQFGTNNFVELSTGELVSSSLSNRSNLLMINPSSGQMTEISHFLDESEIIFIFLGQEDKLITISEGGYVKIWQNGKCLNFFNLKEKILFADLNSSDFIFTNDLLFVTLFDLEVGIYKKTCYSIKEQITALKILSNKVFLTGHRDKIIEWDIESEQNLREYKMYGEVFCIDILNENKFICTTNICMTLVVNCKTIFKNCYENPISSVKFCGDGNILSVGMQDEKVKLWKMDNFDLEYEANVTKPCFARILKSGRLAYTDCQGRVYISD
ncbi:hypothetical protein BpHYR1_022549 [Brachionus plicatilis]|uniref:Uncharacterized protein n=1 Tax=Brachionus plicatilis TaxID=10195 RepID=A0A3M7QCV3_BRAPC|nr:hypothetical protein BpHYR1_022549 [Brachionus plicatilis]